MRGFRIGIAGAAVAAVLFGCRPSSVSEAEEKADIAWLAKRRDREATFALGRLADKNEAAAKAIAALPPSPALYSAAWESVARKSKWGDALMRRDLGSDAANIVATGMSPGDPRLLSLMPELDAALLHNAKTAPTVALMIASIGPEAHAIVDRRIRDASTRDAMCTAVDAASASDDARSAVLALQPAERDSPACTTTIVRLAGEHANVRQWLGTHAEPGLLSVAGRDTLPCPPLAETIKIALTSRKMEAARALVVPLRLAVERCAKELDPVVAQAMTERAEIAPTVAAALDPRAPSTADMHATCAWFQEHRAQLATARTMGDLLATGCKVALAKR